MERVRGIAGVEDVQARATAELTVDLPHEPSLVVEAYDGTARINRPLVREGSNLQSSDLRGCLLDELFARENGLAVGDRIGLKVGGQVYDFLIRGTCLSPEFVSLDVYKRQAITTWVWPPPPRWRPSAGARGRWNAPSTAWASARATPRWTRS